MGDSSLDGGFVDAFFAPMAKFSKELGWGLLGFLLFAAALSLWIGVLVVAGEIVLSAFIFFAVCVLISEIQQHWKRWGEKKEKYDLFMSLFLIALGIFLIWMPLHLMLHGHKINPLGPGVE